jgi:hypothetical protein
MFIILQNCVIPNMSNYCIVSVGPTEIDEALIYSHAWPSMGNNLEEATSA